MSSQTAPRQTLMVPANAFCKVLNCLAKKEFFQDMVLILLHSQVLKKWLGLTIA
jgi:hypothetical protein